MKTPLKIAALAAALAWPALAPGRADAAATFNTCLSNFYYQDMMRSGDPGNCYGAANATFVAINIFNTTPYSVYFTLQANQTDLPPAQGGDPVRVTPTSPSPQASARNLQSPFYRFCGPSLAEYYNGYEQFWGTCTLSPVDDAPFPADSYTPYNPQDAAYVLQNGMVVPPFSQIQLTYLPAASSGGTYTGLPSPFEMIQDAQLTMVMAGPGMATKGAAPVQASAAVGVSFGSSIFLDAPVTMSNTIFNPTTGSSAGNSSVTTSQPVIYAGGVAFFNLPAGTTGANLLPSPYLGSPPSAYPTYGGGLNNADIAVLDNLAPNQASAQPGRPASGPFAMVLRGTVGAPPLGGGPPAFNVQIGKNAANVIGLHTPNASQVQTSIYPAMWNVQQAVPAIGN